MKKTIIPKKIASLGLAVAMVSSTGINIWAQDIQPAVWQMMEAQEIEMPTITTHNIQMISGNTQTLIVNEGYGADNDFTPNLQSKDAYFEFSYPQMIDFTGVQLVGWWPKQQGIKTISFEYYDQGEWQACGTDIEIGWKTPAGVGGPEPLLVELPQQVTSNKFRVRVVDTYRAWGSKCSMKLIKPIGTIAEGSINKKPLFELIQLAESCTKDVLVGTESGEFPLHAVQELEKITQEVKALKDQIMTQEEFDTQMLKLQQAIEKFQDSQNPIAIGSGRPTITTQGLTIKTGKLEAMLDNQLSTFVTFEEAGVLEDAYIYVDFGEDIMALNQLGLIIAQPHLVGMEMIDIECFKEGEWIPITQNKKIEWNKKGYFGSTSIIYQGDVGNFESPIIGSKFRIKLNQTVAGASQSQINELIIRGNKVVDKSTLGQLITQGENIVQDNQMVLAEQLKDLLKITLVEAKQVYQTQVATQSEVEILTSQLQAIFRLIDQEQVEWIEVELEGQEVIQGGETTKLEVMLQANQEPIGAIDLTINYNDQFLSIQPSISNEIFQIVGSKVEENKIRILIAATQPITEKMKVLELEIATEVVKESQSTSITLSQGEVGVVVEGEGKVLPIKQITKSILIQGEKQRPDEDINQDSQVDVADLALVAYYYQAKAGDENWAEASKADVVQDGVIDIKDLVAVAQKMLEK